MSAASLPGPDCPICPRLAEYRAANRGAHPNWHNAPVPSFGGSGARLLIVGLAPGLKGANRTGRPFTGDHAGKVLYATLLRLGFARGGYGMRRDDGLELVDCRISNAVRCVPPKNRPSGAEIAACRRFLEAEIAAMPRLEAILALGVIAHGSLVRALGLKLADVPFAHGAFHDLNAALVLADSYHCSRYNLNTGRLTAAMFQAVVAGLVRRLEGGSIAAYHP